MLYIGYIVVVATWGLEVICITLGATLTISSVVIGVVFIVCFI